MDKKKIETFGEFCELIANEPENVYCDDYGLTDYNKLSNLSELSNSFRSRDYHHIPIKKKKTMAEFYCWHENLGFRNVIVYELRNGEPHNLVTGKPIEQYTHWMLKPKSEFEVDDDG